MIAAFKEQVPDLLFHNTTLVTHGLDLAIIVPASVARGILILKRNPLGFKIAFPLLGVVIFLLPVILLTSYLQYEQGVIFSHAVLAFLFPCRGPDIPKLIFISWQDTKFGTIFNFIIILEAYLPRGIFIFRIC